MTDKPATDLLRSRANGEHARVEYIELFFDLVFVFAITQLSHTLLHHLSPAGVAETGFLLLAVWWVWMYTTWVTNWLDPRRIPVRFMLFALMALGLIVSASIPQAFADRALPFALAYVTMQVGRSVFMALASRAGHPARAVNFARIAIWLATAGVFWIAGALAGHEWQIILWGIALGIEYAGPWARFAVPVLGPSGLDSWDVDPHHMAERCGLFVIIALGESIIITGATFAGLAWTPDVVLAFASALIGALAMWWIYFSIGQEVATHRFAGSANVGGMARLAYTYFHLPIVAGIILAAAGDELVIAHPHGQSGMATILTVVGGAAIYLAGNILFKMAFWGRPPLSHLAGLAALA
ncbi:MAG: low temperature requirement protein A, partial [Rhizobiaceae bacterium]